MIFVFFAIRFWNLKLGKFSFRRANHYRNRSFRPSRCWASTPPKLRRTRQTLNWELFCINVCSFRNLSGFLSYNRFPYFRGFWVFLWRLSWFGWFCLAFVLCLFCFCCFYCVVLMLIHCYLSLGVQFCVGDSHKKIKKRRRWRITL